MVVGLPLRYTDEPCKPPEAAVFKRYGVEPSGKRSCFKRDQVRVRKLNESTPKKLIKNCCLY